MQPLRVPHPVVRAHRSVLAPQALEPNKPRVLVPALRAPHQGRDAVQCPFSEASVKFPGVFSLY